MSAANAFRLRLALALALGLGALGGGLALAIPLTWPTAPLSAGAPVAGVSEARALAAAEGSNPRLEQVRRQTLSTLALRPADPAAWGRLAWVASEEGDVAAMNAALDRSYAVAPFGPDITAWRLRFAYEHWGSLTPALRRLATEELEVTAEIRPGVVDRLRPEIQNPAGRMAFQLTTRAPA